MTTTLIEKYYASNNRLYDEGVDQNIQDEARQVCGIVYQMIHRDDRARDRVNQWAAARPQPRPVYHFTYPLFWAPPLPYYRPRFHTFGRGMAPNGRCNEKECAVALLIMTIAALVIAAAAAIYYTSVHTNHAQEARRQLNEISGLNIQHQQIGAIYNDVIAIQKNEWKSQALKTTFTASIALGTILLTVSAVFALNAVVSDLPISAYGINFAISGGAVLGAGVTGHLIRNSVLQLTRERYIEKLHALFEQVVDLEPPHPYRLLAETGQQNARLSVGHTLYIKEGDTYRCREEAPPTYREERLPEYSVAVR